MARAADGAVRKDPPRSCSTSPPRACPAASAHSSPTQIDAVATGTFLLVEHDLDFVERIADRVSFMHNGRILRTGAFAELSGDPLVQSAYMGTGDER